MSNRPFLNQRIAILEDDSRNRVRLSALVKITGGIPVADSCAPKFSEIDNYLMKENISMMICDHRLFEHAHYANYTGAMAIAACYKSGRGGVLVTSWEKEDAETTIREYRRWIPSLVHSTDLGPETLVAALNEADKEARQKIPAKNRKPYRTLLTVQRIIETGQGKIVKVVMSQWNINEEVGFPINLITPGLHAKIEPGDMLIAKVNIEAKRAEELYFDEFEIADPDVLKKSQHYINHP